FVTGATGLLGNNLVRHLHRRGIGVTALVRSPEKAKQQFAGLSGLRIVTGDMRNVATFAAELPGHDVLFHTAAHFRDSYRGGDHSAMLRAVNVEGTHALMEAAYSAGIRRMVHTSSIAVLIGGSGIRVDETMLRPRNRADAYYRSKIETDEAVFAFLQEHPDFHASIVLPGWMHGPGDMGPTSAGRFVVGFVQRQLPAIMPGAFSLVDARDVAAALVAAAERGKRGERYLAAGRRISTADLCRLMEKMTAVPAPRRKMSKAMLVASAAISELYARTTRKPARLSWASARLMIGEGTRPIFDHGKSERELGVSFRPMEETLSDEIAWYRANGWLPDEA
ncbi:MAG: SDR family oxidoreductase, partial [Parvibaculum sp.]|nr:SDR family oxidoreductase [Parvibaculum sp.]